MAVAVDAVMSGGNQGDTHSTGGVGNTTLTSTGITVGGSATLLVATLCFADGGSGTPPTSVTMTWNGVSMTNRASVDDAASSFASSYIFTLVNPTSGANNLVANWTNTKECYMSAISFTGTDTTTGVQTSDSVTATSTTSLTITSTTDGATVATYAADGGIPTMNFTKLWDYDSEGPGGSGTYTLGGTSNAHTFTGGSGLRKALAGVHVLAGAGGGGSTLWAQSLM